MQTLILYTMSYIINIPLRAICRIYAEMPKVPRSDF